MVKLCNLQTDEPDWLCNLQFLQTSVFNKNPGGHQMLGFVWELFLIPIGMTLAKRNSRRVWLRGRKNKHENHMTTLTAKGNGNIAKGKLKQKFAQLFDDDLQPIEGKQDQLIGRLQKRTAQAREKIEQAVDECCGRTQ